MSEFAKLTRGVFLRYYQKEEATTSFAVSIVEIPADKKIQVMKLIREILDISLTDAKALVDGLPKIVKDALEKPAADHLVKKLTQAGATVTVEGPTTPRLHPQDTPILADGVETTEAFIFRLEDKLNFVLYTLMTSGSAPSLGWSFYQVLRRGYIPIRWMGTWPEGYCVAYCPAGLPHATVPPDCVPTKEQLAAGKAKKSTTKKPVAAKPREPVLVTDPSTWTSLSGASDVSAAFRQHFAQLALTDACKAILDTVSRKVVGIHIGEDALIIEFTPQTITCDNGRTITTPRRLRCTAPYTGKASTLPHSVESVLRLHNGMQGEQALAPLEWFVFNGKRFVMDWSLWWTADPDDPEEIFAEPPQVPLTDGDDIWLLHPTATGSDGEPALVRMSHETADLSKPLAFGAGGAFLRLMAHAFDPERTGILLRELRGRE